jgi:hypothetical protein
VAPRFSGGRFIPAIGAARVVLIATTTVSANLAATSGASTNRANIVAALSASMITSSDEVFGAESVRRAHKSLTQELRAPECGGVFRGSRQRNGLWSTGYTIDIL